MTQAGPTHSFALRAAQDLLLAKRRQRQPVGPTSDLTASSKIRPSFPSREGRPFDLDPMVPGHLGWGSDPLSDHLRSARQAYHHRKQGDQTPDLSWLDALAPAPVKSEPPPPSSTTSARTITLHPDIALAMLRQEQTAAGRIWLLLRHIDEKGAGWLDDDQVRALLTDKGSKLKVCGWRQLRNLFRKGEGLFWQRSNGRIWLRSVAKVAAALHIRQIKGIPVAIPVEILTRGMGAVRAHFYASFHSSRAVKSRSGAQTSMPIARKTIREICRISRRTQRKYETTASIRTRHNYAIGPQTTADSKEESAWQHGQALFQFIDHKGTRGTPGASYLAWQLPNSYFGPHARQPRGRQKRINRELADLFTQGMTGNGECLVPNEDLNHSQRFYGNGRGAAKAYNRRAPHDLYWCAPQSKRIRQNVGYWHCLPVRTTASK